MKLSISLFVTSWLLANSAYASGIHIGPFNMEFGPVGHEYKVNNGSRWENRYIPNSRAFLENPICYAIANLKRLEMVVDLEKYINPKEMKITSIKFTIEPHIFGLAKDGRLALQGKIISEKMLKEVNIKYGEDKFDELIPPLQHSNKNNEEQDQLEDESEDYLPLYDTGQYKGKFNPGKDSSEEIRRIRWLKVIEDSNFEVPKDFKQINDDHMLVICQLPEVKKNEETAPKK